MAIIDLKDMHFISNFLILTGLFIGFTAHAQNPLQSQTEAFSAPLEIPMYLSGNYGELRSTHFHAGIDIKTQQEEGKNVLAADSGTVIRIVVQTGGYGHALYLSHPGGKMTVYAHMRQFTPEVDKWVKEEQYRQKSFEVDLSPRSGQFTFSKGALIGFSGNTGNSGGPHLHFEIRGASGVPYNVLKYVFDIGDAIPPKISLLAVYPLGSGMVNGSDQKLMIPVPENKGTYLVDDTVAVFGNIGFGIETYDFLNNSVNPCSPYSISLRVDNRLQFQCRFDSIPFEMAGYVNSQVDYEEKLKSGKSIQKLFVDPNNKLTIYKMTPKRGIVRFTDQSIHVAEVRVTDAYGNESMLTFHIRSTTSNPLTKSKTTAAVARFYYDSLNVFENSDVRVVVPGNALFDNINFQFSSVHADSFQYSPLFLVHNEYTPLFKSYMLSLCPHDLPESLYDKALIIRMDYKGALISLGGTYKNGFVTARANSFGKFFVAVDTVVPKIEPLVFANERYSGGQVLSFRITDDLSGILRYAGYIDNKWSLFEYDAKNKLLYYVIDENRLEKNRSHNLELIVTDNKENVSKLFGSFFF